MITRRQWLIRTAAAAPLACGVPRLWAGGAELPKFLLVFLRGAYDAHNLLVPHGSPFYYEARPNIAIARPGSGADAAIRLDDQWGLAPAVTTSLLPLWQNQQLAFVPFAGIDDTSRSHFETQDRIELGLTGGERLVGSGFLNRLAAEIGVQNQAGAEALAFTDKPPMSCQGPVRFANQGLRNLSKSGVDDRQAAMIRRMYAGTPLDHAVNDGFETRSEVMREMADEMDKASRNAIGTKGFETEARRIGRLMRERVALGFVDVGGWDTHVGQGGAQGALANKLQELSLGLSGFVDELGAQQWARTVVVVVSEFGRTFRENGNRGTDHGHGTTYWVLGGGVHGGKVAGRQQALAADTLFQNRDMQVLNDYRAVLAGLWARQYGLSAAALARVFPGVVGSDLGLI